MLSDRQVVELFHLHFIRLVCFGPDKDRFAIKGGANLRFFFESVRYSDDIGIDFEKVPVQALKEKVGKILEGPALRLSLGSRGISVTEVSAPKQTETTQRWKIGLTAERRSLPLHTKIEFSRRKTAERARVEPVGASVLAEYQLMPLLAPHYPLDAALRQKVGALVGRSTVQARDVFDLVVLLSKTGGKADALRPIRSEVAKAIERAMDVSYADFKSQVGSYLKPEHQDQYGTRQAWDAMQAQVIEQFEKVLA